MKKRADWLAWSLQFLSGFFIGALCSLMFIRGRRSIPLIERRRRLSLRSERHSLGRLSHPTMATSFGPVVRILSSPRSSGAKAGPVAVLRLPSGVWAACWSSLHSCAHSGCSD